MLRCERSPTADTSHTAASTSGCTKPIGRGTGIVRDALTEWLAALTSTERAALDAPATRETLTLNIA